MRRTPPLPPPPPAKVLQHDASGHEAQIVRHLPELLAMPQDASQLGEKNLVHQAIGGPPWRWYQTRLRQIDRKSPLTESVKPGFTDAFYAEITPHNKALRQAGKDKKELNFSKEARYLGMRVSDQLPSSRTLPQVIPRLYFSD